MTRWEIKGEEFSNCNCDYGCPCQFNSLPTHGTCEAVMGYKIAAGHYGDVTLDGLRAAIVVWWPGPIHEGDGKLQIIVDDAVSEAQGDALMLLLDRQVLSMSAKGCSSVQGEEKVREEGGRVLGRRSA